MTQPIEHLQIGQPESSGLAPEIRDGVAELATTIENLIAVEDMFNGYDDRLVAVVASEKLTPSDVEGNKFQAGEEVAAVFISVGHDIRASLITEPQNPTGLEEWRDLSDSVGAIHKPLDPLDVPSSSKLFTYKKRSLGENMTRAHQDILAFEIPDNHDLGPDSLKELNEGFVNLLAEGAAFQRFFNYRVGEVYSAARNYFLRDDVKQLLGAMVKRDDDLMYDLSDISKLESAEERALYFTRHLCLAQDEKASELQSGIVANRLSIVTHNSKIKQIFKNSLEEEVDRDSLGLFTITDEGVLRKVVELDQAAQMKAAELRALNERVRKDVEIGSLEILIDQFNQFVELATEHGTEETLLEILGAENSVVDIIAELDSRIKNGLTAEERRHYRSGISTTVIRSITRKPLHALINGRAKEKQSPHETVGAGVRRDWRAELEEIGKEFAVSSAELRKGDPGFSLVQLFMDSGMDKELAKRHVGFLLSISSRQKNSSIDDCFNALLRSIGEEADIAHQASYSLNGTSLYSLTNWMASLKDDSKVFAELPGFLQTAVRNFDIFKSGILESVELSDLELDEEGLGEHTTEEEGTESDTEGRKLPIDLVNQFERLNFEIFPPGTQLQDIRDGLESQLSADVLLEIDWERIEALIGWRDRFSQDGGDSVSTRLYRSEPGVLKVRFPHFVLEIDVIDAGGEVARVVVAETPVQDNGTYVYREREGYEWPDVFSGFKKDARVYGALMVPHDDKKRRANGSHSTRVEAALMSELTAI